MLIGLIAIFVVGFLAIAGGVAYLLWPTPRSSSPTALAAGPANDNPMEPLKNLDQIMKDAPNPPGNVAGPPPIAAPAFAPPPLPDPGFAPPPAPPPMPRRPPANPRRPGDAPKLPPLVGAPKFQPVSPLSIQPMPLSRDREERSLPGAAETAIPAGGGRLILLHLPRLKKIAVFDVNTGKVARYVDVADDRALIAGGMNLFVVYLPGTNVLERWNCTTLEREAELKGVLPEEVKGLAMGASTNGPLVAALGGSRRTVHGGATLGYFDPATGKEVAYEVGGAENPFGLGIHNAPAQLRVSADGSVVAAWGANGHGGTQTDVIEGGRITRHWQFGWLDTVIPGPDGRTLYGKGIRYPPELKMEQEGREDHDNPVWLIPAVHGDSFVSLRASPSKDRRPPRKGVVDICVGPEGKSILSLGELTNFDVPAGFFESRGKAFDQNLVLVPEARALIVVPPKKRDQLVIHKVDMEKALSRAGFDYLIVTSQPPAEAAKGSTYRYTTVVKSKKGGVKVVLESGPKGMAVTPAGAVSWDVPRDHPESEVVVILKVTDAAGGEVFHSFRLMVRGKEAGKDLK